MQVLNIINICLSAVFLLCYFYQFIYLVIAYVGGIKKYPDAPPSKLAVIIAARNEEGVIANLIGSLMEQDYPREFFDVFVVADNCTDSTAAVAREAGAIVYERQNQLERGKGYAVDFLLKSIQRDRGEDAYDAFIVFDADNVAEKNYLTEMNKAFAAGYEVVSSYRNASNYGRGWRAAGQGMYFLRDARVLNLARVRIGGNTFIAGTGFLFSNEICKRYGGWPFHTLTEDGEFTLHNAVNDAKSGYCNSAMFYDEQAVDRKTSWNQKLRWCKGGLQIFRKYFTSLVKGLFSGKIGKFLACFDMMMCLAPAYIISLTAVAINIVACTVLLILGTHPLTVLLAVLPMIGGAYMSLFVFGLVVTISDWKKIRASSAKKILYIFTFPLFIFSFIPAAFVALFKKVEWKQIKHEGAN
ncbi:MAG: glycosyltransferase family 2 protein [Clostridia bacterium]|nr:glycosyltransferase family 2 protein [Clostridia bacterium]